MTDLKRFAATLLFWGVFAFLEMLVMMPLAAALAGSQAGAITLIVLLIACLAGGAYLAVPRYNKMIKSMDEAEARQVIKGTSDAGARGFMAVIYGVMGFILLVIFLR